MLISNVVMYGKKAEDIEMKIQNALNSDNLYCQKIMSINHQKLNVPLVSINFSVNKFLRRCIYF